MARLSAKIEIRISNKECNLSAEMDGLRFFIVHVYIVIKLMIICKY